MKNLFTLCFLILSLQCFAQTTISGTVIDDSGEPVIGANIFIQNSYDGASSLEEGTFSFVTTMSGQQTLQVTFIGYEAYEQVVELKGDEVVLNVELKELFNELEAVVVTAGSFEASDKKKSVILKPLDIVLTAGANADIAGALNTLPGTQRVGEEGQLFVRGGAASETLTFIDGMRVQNPYASSVPTIPSRGRFSPFLFKGTMFSTGGYSAEYGQALSSALLLETQDLAPEDLTSVSLMSIGGGLSHAQRWDSTSLSVSLNYTDLTPYTGLMPQNLKWEKPFSSLSGQVIFRHQFSPTGILKYHGDLNQSDFSLYQPLAEDVTKTALLKLNNNYQYHNVSVREIIGEKWTVRAGLSYSENTDQIEQNFAYNTDDQTGQVKLVASYQVNDKISTKFGATYLHRNFQEQFIDIQDANFKTKLIEKYKAAFSETNIYLSKKLVVRIGLRAEHSGLLNEWNVAPRLSLAYQTGKYSQMSLAYGTFYQNPDVESLRYSRPDFEQANHYLVNFQRTKNNRTFRAEYYYKQYDQLVKFNSEPTFTVDNSGSGYATGVDVFYRDRETIKNGDFWLSYSFLDTERNHKNFPKATTPSFASAHNFAAVYKHFLSKQNVLVGATYSFSSGRPYDDPNTADFNDQRTKHFHDLSFNGSYLTNLFGHFTVLYVSVSNVLGINQSFGRRFSTTPNAEGQFSSVAVQPGAKRFAFVGLFISFGKKYDKEDQ